MYISEMVVNGGAPMVMLVLLGVVSVTTVIERLFLFKRYSINSHKLLVNAKNSIANNSIGAMKLHCQSNPAPGTNITYSILGNYGKELEVTQRDAVDVLRRDKRKLTHGLRLLQVSSKLAVYIGLFGTILGLINSFRSVSSQTINQISIPVISNGIWQALATTALGMGIAIPLIIAYEYLAATSTRIVQDAEDIGTGLIRYIYLEYQQKDNSNEAN